MRNWSTLDWVFTVGPFVVIGGIAWLSVIQMRRRMR